MTKTAELINDFGISTEEVVKAIPIFSLFKAPITERDKKPDRDACLFEVAALIKSETLKVVTEKGRNIKGKADFSSYKQRAFDFGTFSCTVTQKGESYIKGHSNLFCVDVDGLPDIKAVKAMKERVLKASTPALMFISPSGLGLKVVYQIDLSQGTHKQYFAAFQYFFKDQFDVEIDKKCGDVSRACFLCHDPDCFFSEDPTILGIDFLDTFSFDQSAQPEKRITEDDQITTIECLKVWADNKYGFTEGNRNGYITQLAGAFNRVGISESLALDTLLGYAEYGFTEDEIKSTVKSIYRNKKLHGISRFNDATGDFEDTLIDVTDETPLIPIEGFPVFIQQLIKEYNQVYGTHPDLIAAAILSATSTALGQSVTAKNKYENPALLWMAVVGGSGSGKTGAYNFAFKRVNEIDYRAFQEYKNKTDLWQLEIASQKKGSIKISKPDPCAQHIVIDSTPEALAKAMATNPRGTTLLRDELNGLFQDFGRYSKSGEQQNLLSAWSQTPFKVNRANGDNLFIKEPFLNIFGGIQPGIVPEMAKDGRAVNGFLQRFCFVFPDNIKAPSYSFTELSDKLKTGYTKYIDKLLSIKAYREPVNLDYDAQEEYADFCNKNAALNNSGIPDYLKEVNAKLNIIVKRIALLLHYSNWVYAKIPETTISLETMIAAIKLAEYFRLTQQKIYKIINQSSAGGDKKEIIKYLISLKGNSQTDVAKIMHVSQQHISKILKQ